MPCAEEPLEKHRVALTRRSFIRWGAVALLGSLTPAPVLAALRDSLNSQRSVSLHHSYTGESLRLLYYADGQYLPQALEEAAHFLRDFRNDAVKPVDVNLLDYLYAIKKKLQTQRSFLIISGYRSPETNALLRRKSRGVAKNSFHMYGRAVDFRLQGYRVSTLKRAATDLHFGGVGYYPRSKFLHIDTGEFRTW